MKKSNRLSLRLTADQRERLKAAAKGSDRSENYMARKYIDQGLERDGYRKKEK